MQICLIAIAIFGASPGQSQESVQWADVAHRASVDPAALVAALVRRTRSLVPNREFDARGVIAELAESWTDDDDLAEALEFLSRRYLEELQEDVMLGSRERWPATMSGELPEAFALVDLESQTIAPGYATSDERFRLDPISLDECLRRE